MTVKLTNNFFAKARGLIFEDGGGVTWSFDPTTNELTATASGGGSVTLGNGPPSTLISEGAIYFDLTSGTPLQGWVQVPNSGDPDWTDVVLLLPFDGTAGQTVITDSSLTANAMTELSPAALTVTTPKFGTASGNFTSKAGSGWSTPISPGSPLDLESAPSWTVECWVKTTDTNNGKIFSDLTTYPGSTQYLRMYYNAGHIQTQIGWTGTVDPTNTLIAVDDGNWHHVVFQASASLGQSGVAVDGQWDTLATYVVAPSPNPNNLFMVGFDSFDPVQGNSFFGQIDDMRVTLGQRYILGTNFTPPAAAFATTGAADVWEEFGTDITIDDGSTTVAGVKNITLSGGTVSGTSPNVTLTLGGIEFTDGANTVLNANKLTITGGTVGGASPNATLAITGGGGGGSSNAPGGVFLGLYQWFQADLLAGTNGTAQPQLLNGSGFGALCPLNASVSGATLDTTGLNSKNVVDFPGTSAGRYLFSTATINQQALNSVTCFAVLKSPVMSSTVGVLLCGSTNSFQYGTDGAGHMNIVCALVAAIASSTSTLADSTWYQTNVTYNGTSGAYSFRTGQTADGSGTNAIGIAAGSVGFGYNVGASVQDFDGSLAEFISYNRVLTGAEILAVEAYLNTKWGV